MKKITISQEGSAPITISVGEDNPVTEKHTISCEAWETEIDKPDCSDIKNPVDRAFAECLSLESANMSVESMPRLSSIKPISITGRRSFSRNVFAESIDKYMEGQSDTVNKIKSYISKKGWTNVGIAGLNKVPTLITYIFKTGGLGSWKDNFDLANARKCMFEKEYNGLKIVWIHTDKTNNSAKAKQNDTRAAKDAIRGFLVLSKPGSTRFFTKVLTPIIRINSENNGASNYSTSIDVNKK